MYGDIVNGKSYELKGEKFGPSTLILNPRLPQPLQRTKEAFRPDFDLSPPELWPQWLKNMHTEGAAVEIVKDDKVIWWGGTVHDGIWMDGLWMGGCWRDGIWLGGEFLDGKWCTGEWRGGNFRRGYWMDGVFRAGYFAGLWLGGLWMGGEFEGFWRRTKEPPMYR